MNGVDRARKTYENRKKDKNGLQNCNHRNELSKTYALDFLHSAEKISSVEKKTRQNYCEHRAQKLSLKKRNATQKYRRSLKRQPQFSIKNAKTFFDVSSTSFLPRTKLQNVMKIKQKNRFS